MLVDMEFLFECILTWYLMSGRKGEGRVSSWLVASNTHKKTISLIVILHVDSFVLLWTFPGLEIILRHCNLHIFIYLLLITKMYYFRMQIFEGKTAKIGTKRWKGIWKFYFQMVWTFVGKIFIRPSSSFGRHRVSNVSFILCSCHGFQLMGSHLKRKQ